MEYFAVNASIGRSAYNQEVDFPDAQSLLAHMDYLGIDRMLVESIQASEYSPINGNRRLLQELLPHQERLKPVFVITPSDFYEQGTLDWLQEQAAAGNKAYRVRPDISRFALRQIERLLAELAAYQPLIMLDAKFSSTEMDFRDLEELAGKYPSCNFLLTSQMWGGFGRVMDLMWRRQNIYLEISWLHMRDSLELLRDQFGIQRLLFGIGYKSHYAAAIGCLAHSKLSDSEKAAVAHGNLEKLLGMEPIAHKLAAEHPLLQDKPLWRNFSAGGKLSGLPTFDCHSHDGPFTRGWYLTDLADPQQRVEAIMQHIAGNGVEKIAMIGESALFGEPLAGNLEFEQITEKYRGKLFGMFVYNPYFKESLGEKVLDEFFSRDFFIGFKVLPSYWHVKIDSPDYNGMWEYADKYHLPVLIHTWEDPWNAPMMLDEIVKKHPNAKFILGHSGGSAGGRRQAEELALRHSNVFLELCGTFCSSRSVYQSMLRLGKERFVFGSDAVAHNQSYELAAFLSIPLPDSELAVVLGENFLNILKDRKKCL